MPNETPPAPPNRQVDRHIRQLAQGDHVCLLYRDATEQLANAVPFVKAGFRRGERCVYISDDGRTIDAMTAALAAAGVVPDVDANLEHRSRAFSLVTKHDAYLRSGTFDPADMMAFLQRVTDEALADGFRGLCVTGEMTWALGSEPGCERLIEYEARLNDFFPGSRAVALCQYDQSRFSPALIRDALRTHPTVVAENGVCRGNPQYQSPTRQQVDTDMATGWLEDQCLTGTVARIPMSRKPSDVALFAERDTAGRILVWCLETRGVAQRSSELGSLVDRGRRLARERQVSLCVVSCANATRAALIESHRRGPWRRQHGGRCWEGLVLRTEERFVAHVNTVGGRSSPGKAYDSLVEALVAADRAVPDHICSETCMPWRDEG
jgi:hypothetical protein